MLPLDDVPFSYYSTYRLKPISTASFMAVYFPVLIHLNGVESLFSKSSCNIYTTFVSSVLKHSEFDTKTVLLFLDFLQTWTLRRIFDLKIEKKTLNIIQEILENDKSSTLSNILVDFVRGNNKTRDNIIRKALERKILSCEYIHSLRISVPNICIQSL